jgi:hypothetical protein
MRFSIIHNPSNWVRKYNLLKELVCIYATVRLIPNAGAL